MLDPDKIISELVPVFRPILALSKTDRNYILRKSNLIDCRSEGPFSTMQIIAFNAIGTGEQGCVIDDVGLQMAQDYEIVIRITSYGSRATYRLNTLRTKVSKYPSVCGQLAEKGFGFLIATDVLDITDLNNTDYEERAFTDMTLSCCEGDFHKYELPTEADEGKAGVATFDEDVYPIKSVPIDGTLVGSTNPLNETYTVTQ